MHTHPFLQKHSSLNKTSLFWISHTESSERRRRPAATCFLYRAYRNGAAWSPRIAVHTSPRFAGGLSAGPRELLNNLQSPLPAGAGNVHRDKAGLQWVVDRTEPFCRRKIFEAGSVNPKVCGASLLAAPLLLLLKPCRAAQVMIIMPDCQQETSCSSGHKAETGKC